MAVRADSGEARSYRLDRIVSARATQRAFSPRYPVELTPTGPLSIPARETRLSGGRFGGGLRLPRARVRAPQTGPTYVFRCTVCGKEFERKSYDGTLRAHKNGRGLACYGRLGTYVRTKYLVRRLSQSSRCNRSSRAMWPTYPMSALAWACRLIDTQPGIRLTSLRLRAV
jgi:hypothetical protein